MNEGCSSSNQEGTNRNNLMEISNTVSQRLKSGAVCEERLAKYESFWIDKLAAIDEKHTTQSGLTPLEANRILNVLDQYVDIRAERTCPVDSLKVTDCLRSSKGNTLACDLEVASFKKCVDKSLHYAVSDARKSKKESYSETFERIHKT